MADSIDAEKPPFSTRSGIALAIGGTFLFALKSIFIKLAFAEGASPTIVLTLRMVFSLPFYIGVLCYLRRDRNAGTPNGITLRQFALAFCLGFLGYYLASLLDLTGLDYISAQLERLTLFTYPAIIAVLAWAFLSEPLTRKIVLAIVLCYAGVYVMYRGEQTVTMDSKTTAGVLLVIGSAISYSVYVIFAKPAMQRIGSLRFTSVAMIGSTVFIAIHFAALESVNAVTALPPIVYVYGCVLALFCTVLPSFMINEAIVRLGATRTTIVGSLGPVLTMLLAISVLQEPSSMHHFLGMAMVVGGVGFIAKQ